MFDNLAIPTTTPIIVANIIPITETKIVFNKPTRYALKYECDPSNSINENCTSKEDSWDKNHSQKLCLYFPY